MISRSQLEQEMTSCTLCRKHLSGTPVQCPPGKLYPTPSINLKVLFVGVAPPRSGDHFYSNPADKLRLGLLPLLGTLGYPCRSIKEFLDRGFFLTHTAKCAVAGNWRANPEVSSFCAPRFLRREIEILRPKVVCILSKTVGPAVAADLCRAWGNASTPAAGDVVDVELPGGRIRLLVTSQPVRGWGEKFTRGHLAAVLEKI
jgi:uracil-DNA glycosylase